MPGVLADPTKDKVETLKAWTDEAPNLMQTLRNLSHPALLQFLQDHLNGNKDTASLAYEMRYLEKWDGTAESLHGEDLVYYILQLENHGMLRQPSVWRHDPDFDPEEEEEEEADISE